MGRLPAEANGADTSNLAQRDAREFGVEVHDQLAHRRRQAARSLVRMVALGGQQPHHPLSLEPVGFAVDRPLGLAGLARSLRGGLAVQHHRPDQLVDGLLRPLGVQAQLLPVLSPLDALLLQLRRTGKPLPLRSHSLRY